MQRSRSVQIIKDPGAPNEHIQIQNAEETMDVSKESDDEWQSGWKYYTVKKYKKREKWLLQKRFALLRTVSK
jgi:hypothetical protein